MIFELKKMNAMLTLRRRESLAGLLFAAIPVIGFAVFYIIPFCISVQKTFTAPNDDQYIGFSHYTSVLHSDAFLLAVGNTLKFIAIGVPLLMVLALALGIILNSRVRGMDGFRAVYVLPMVLPTASVILVFQIVFDSGGIINYILSKLGCSIVAILNSANAFWVLLLLYIWKNVGYIIILMLAGLNQIPKEYYESANIDGADWFHQFVGITVPLMTPTFFFIMIISISGAFKSFREAFALSGSYPHKSIYMLQHFMNNNFARMNYPRLSVAAVLTFLIIFAFVLVLYLWRGKGGEPIV